MQLWRLAVRYVNSSYVRRLKVKVSVTEPSDAVKAGMAKQTDGRRVARNRKSTSVSSLVGCQN